MSNPLKDILSKIVGGEGSNTAVGIDIGSSAIKVVEIKKKGGKLSLETYGAIALGPYAELEAGAVGNVSVEKISEALKEVLKQSGVSSYAPAVAIPSQLSLIFTLDLPSQIKTDNISEIITTEARKYIPLPIEEVSIDYFIFPKKEMTFEEMHSEQTTDTNTQTDLGEKTSVLVVATQKEAVSKYRTIMSQSNLSASFFEIEIFSAIRSNFEHELSPVLLVDFGASRTKLAIVEFGMLKAFHSIDRGGADITASIAQSMNINFATAEKMKKDFGLSQVSEDKTLVDIINSHVDYIFNEANSVVLNYEKKHDRIISKVIFTGGGALLKGLAESAHNNFRAEVIIGQPFDKVGAPSFLSKVLESVGGEFAVALGLALRKIQ